MVVLRSPIRYVGGKGRIAGRVAKVLRQGLLRAGRFVDAFVGGGSLTIELLKLLREKPVRGSVEFYAYDVNPVLIAMWNWIEYEPESLCRQMERFSDFSEAAFELMKEEYNRLVFSGLYFQAVPLFIALNHLCWRGVMRVNKHGEMTASYESGKAH
jgi:site-specific DNA-adenine methylase